MENQGLLLNEKLAHAVLQNNDGQNSYQFFLTRFES